MVHDRPNNHKTHAHHDAAPARYARAGDIEL